jgi:hypothetical protein
MVAFVKEYAATPRREPVYHDQPPPMLSGHELGKQLLADLRDALAKKEAAAPLQKAP